MDYDYDLFISHASEDKTAIVRPLSERLRTAHYQIWYDEFELKVGDSLTETIDYGLANSSCGIVVLSRSFFQKKWPRRELVGLSTRQIHEKTTRLIPTWHEVTLEDVVRFSPPLADIKSLNAADGLDRILEEIRRVVTPSNADISQTTIEEAKELLDKGLFEPSHAVALQAWDRRLFNIFKRAVSDGLVGVHGDVHNPHSALDVLRSQLTLCDDIGNIDLDYVQDQWDRGLAPSFAAGPMITAELATRTITEVERFIRANPLP